MLAGKRILVVEDEPIVAMMLEDLLEDLGAVTVGPASTVSEASRLIDGHALNGAILDINLGTERSHAIALRLQDLGVPFIFATGYGTSAAGAFAETEIVEKPYRRDHVAAALRRAMKLP
jgi:DNA-binding NtrC family response regulator